MNMSLHALIHIRDNFCKYTSPKMDLVTGFLMDLYSLGLATGQNHNILVKVRSIGELQQ